jgi:hypothetical protein
MYKNAGTFTVLLFPIMPYAKEIEKYVLSSWHVAACPEPPTMPSV